MKTLLLATGNPGKVAEFRALLDLPNWTLVTPRELGVDWVPPEETGDTFAENARLKAQSLAAQAGLPALADDSGLCVDALGGAPGVHSARWAGEGVTDAERTSRLLERLVGVPPDERTARFVCAVALALPDGSVVVEEGVCEGLITGHPRGQLGFGYDPIFSVPALGQTFAEMAAEDKNRVSHRALALQRLRPRLLSPKMQLNAWDSA